MTELHGYAIVSKEGAIADCARQMPDCLRFDADFARFQSALDASDLTLIGRLTHLAAPNFKRRQRLVVSTTRHSDAPELCRYWWKPGCIPLEQRLVQLPFSVAYVAVVGGLGVFDLVLQEPGYDYFELTIAGDSSIQNGVPIFSGVGSADDAVTRLNASGLYLVEERRLPGADGLRLLRFRRA